LNRFIAFENFADDVDISRACETIEVKVSAKECLDYYESRCVSHGLKKDAQGVTTKPYALSSHIIMQQDLISGTGNFCQFTMASLIWNQTSSAQDKNISREIHHMTKKSVQLYEMYPSQWRTSSGSSVAYQD
jgi:hypothetical protein